MSDKSPKGGQSEKPDKPKTKKEKIKAKCPDMPATVEARLSNGNGKADVRTTIATMVEWTRGNRGKT
jgi:hypothetical protein